MSTNGLLKLILGIALLFTFFPAGYLNLPQPAMYIVAILAAVLGIKLILDGINQL